MKTTMSHKLLHLALLGAGLWLAFAFRAEATTYYVNVSNTVPVAPFTSWSTAATNIQDAIDTSTDGDLVLVTNGIYNSGGRSGFFSAETNRVVLTNFITLLSVNGPKKTFIVGGNQTRCAYVGSNSFLGGFTLTNGQAGSGGPSSIVGSGGGAWCETGGVISNCLVVSNFALAFGAGVFGGTVYDSTIASNTITYNRGGGGGACSNVLINCILTKNNAYSVGSVFGGGGAMGSALTNCQIVGNASTKGGGTSFSTLVGCSISNNIANSGDGGGMYQGFAMNSLVSSNYAVGYGGGVCAAMLDGCILFSNVADGYGYSSYGGGGAYNGTLTNCILYGNSTPYGVNGGGAYGSALFACTVANNSAYYGGGAYGGMLVSCTIVSNYAKAFGGGVSESVLTNCLLAWNSTPACGGGANSSLLINCTLIGNSANLGGGAYQGTLNNCISYYNYNNVGAGSNYFGSTLNYCCSFPLPAGGSGNFTNAPLFVNPANDFHLQSSSPCINAGKNIYVYGTNDLDGNPRIVGGTVDIGAYEFQTPTSVLSYAWAQQYGLPTDGSADYVDSDGDGLNNWSEWIAGTVPTNVLSVLKMNSVSNSLASATVTWQSVTNVTYYLQRSTNLPAFTSIQSNLVGQANSTSYTDTTATNGGSYFYRVGVQ